MDRRIHILIYEYSKHKFTKILYEIFKISCVFYLRKKITYWKKIIKLIIYTVCIILDVCLFVFNVPSTARSFRDGTPIYCPLRRTWSSVNTPSRPGIELRAVAWQSITLPLCHGKLLHTWCLLSFVFYKFFSLRYFWKFPLNDFMKVL